jgi:hypothetical protein
MITEEGRTVLSSQSRNANMSLSYISGSLCWLLEISVLKKAKSNVENLHHYVDKEEKI